MQNIIDILHSSHEAKKLNLLSPLSKPKGKLYA